MTQLENYLNNGAFVGEINSVPEELRDTIRHQLFYEATEAGKYGHRENRRTASELHAIAKGEINVDPDNFPSPSQTPIDLLQPLTRKILIAISDWVLNQKSWILANDRIRTKRTQQGHQFKFPYMQPRSTGLLGNYYTIIED